MDRRDFTVRDSVLYLWRGLGLPEDALKSLNLPGTGPGLPSSFKIGDLAQTSIALSALAAALVYAHRTSATVPEVTVPFRHAVIEFKSERLYTLDGKPGSMQSPIGGVHITSDGYVRLHDAFPNHREGALRLLGCEGQANSRRAVSEKISHWTAIDLETSAIQANLAVAALRSYEQWDSLPQATAIADFPIVIRKVTDGPAGLAFPTRSSHSGEEKCLGGLRVIELSRVIASPVAGKCLAAHGAQVLWVTSPNLPDLPTADRDLARGKRTIQLDIKNGSDKDTLESLVQDADVFLQGFRPGSLMSKGFSLEQILQRRRSEQGIVYASLSAYGPTGPWRERRGFDSLVQTCSGMNISEADHYGDGAAFRETPCQALDHASGYLLAAGINAALARQATEGGSYEVDVSLAGVMKYLRSLGQYEGKTGFQCADYTVDVSPEYFETKESGFGSLRAVKHSATVHGISVGYDVMPKPLGSDRAEWL